MTDLYIAIAIVLGVSTLLGGGTFRLAARGRRRSAGVVALAAVGLLVVDVAWFRHSLWPARWLLPFSNMIVLADVIPELTAVVAGAALALMPGRMARRCVLVVPLVGLAIWASYAPLVAPPPRQLEDRWRGGVCRQSSASSCAAAAAATLLTTAGIPATEAEMARLCLTSADGTSSRGLYRGLKLKTVGTAWDVAPYAGGQDVDALRRAGGPFVLTVRLDPGADVDPRFVRDWGWAPGMSHNVVLLGWLGDGRCRVGDPDVGAEVWDRRALEALWHGEAIALSPRRREVTGGGARAGY